MTWVFLFYFLIRWLQSTGAHDVLNGKNNTEEYSTNLFSNPNTTFPITESKQLNGNVSS